VQKLPSNAFAGFKPEGLAGLAPEVVAEFSNDQFNELSDDAFAGFQNEQIKELDKKLIAQIDKDRFSELTSEGIGGFGYTTGQLLPEEVFESLDAEQFGDLGLGAIAGLKVEQFDAIESQAYGGFDVDAWDLPGDCDCNIVENLDYSEFKEIADKAWKGFDALDSLYMGKGLKKALAFSEVVKEIDAKKMGEILPENLANMMPETTSLLSPDAISGIIPAQLEEVNVGFLEALDEDQFGAIQDVSSIRDEVIADMDGHIAEKVTSEQMVSLVKSGKAGLISDEFKYGLEAGALLELPVDILDELGILKFESVEHNHNYTHEHGNDPPDMPPGNPVEHSHYYNHSHIILLGAVDTHEHSYDFHLANDTTYPPEHDDGTHSSASGV